MLCEAALYMDALMLHKTSTQSHTIEWYVVLPVLYSYAMLCSQWRVHDGPVNVCHYAAQPSHAARTWRCSQRGWSARASWNEPGCLPHGWSWTVLHKRAPAVPRQSQPTSSNFCTHVQKHGYVRPTDGPWQLTWKHVRCI